MNEFVVVEMTEDRPEWLPEGWYTITRYDGETQFCGYASETAVVMPNAAGTGQWHVHKSKKFGPVGPPLLVFEPDQLQAAVMYAALTMN
jgi:hypothetical protein